MLRRLRLSRQLVILVSLVIILSVLLNAGFALFRESRLLRQTLEDRGDVLMDLTSSFLFTPLYFSDTDDIDTILDRLVQDQAITFAQARDVNGQIVETGEAQGIPEDVLQRLALLAARQDDTIFYYTADQLVATKPVTFQSVNAGVLTIGLSQAELSAQQRSIIIQSALAALLWITLGIAGTVLIARYVTRPVSDLTTAADTIRQGNFDISLPQANSHELNTLSETFEQMAAAMQQSQAEIELRVVERTRQLELVTEISEQISAILDVDRLLSDVVNRVRDEFDYYHAHVYLLDDNNENLVMIAGTGRAGAEMKTNRHRIPLYTPTSLVARAARAGDVVRVDNVREADDWLENPLLPDTYSEMAVPIILEEQVVGVLDVQEDEIGGLDDSDASLLRSLANQVAVTVRNARLFEEVEVALDEARAAQVRYREQAWEQSRMVALGGRHEYVKPSASPLIEEKRQALIQLQQQSLQDKNAPMRLIEDADSSEISLIAPINLQDQAIGTLHLYTSGPDQSWTEDDLAVVEAVIDQFIQTAKNLRLFDEARERAGREQTIREISDKLRAAPNLDLLLETAARELGQRLSVQDTVLELGVEPRTSSPEDHLQPTQNGHRTPDTKPFSGKPSQE